MTSQPIDLRYHPEHMWVRPLDGDRVEVGITDFAQQQLGDITYIHLPDVNEPVSAGEPLGEIESAKAVSDLFAPASGVVDTVNGAVLDNPELVNEDPYGKGWMLRVRLSEPAAASDLLDAAGYESTIRPSPDADF